MENLFNDILSLEDVKGVMLFTPEAEVLVKKFSKPPAHDFESSVRWLSFLQSLDEVREADLLFETGRFYIRKTALGHLLVLTGVLAPIAMLRLQCDMLLPSLKQIKPASKGLRGFFTKKK